MSKNQKSMFGVLMAAVVLAAMVSCSKGPKVELYAFKCGVLKTQTQYMLKDTRVGTPMAALMSDNRQNRLSVSAVLVI